jgi:4-amino-4-deoxy-L-arabinose transferase-like glycosyltransferase
MAKRKKAFKVLDVETKCDPEEDREEPRQPFYLKYKFELLLIVTLIVSFLIRLYLATKIIAATDEGVHLYESSLILKGLTPYKDFTYTRQPVAKYILAFFFMIFGQNLFTARLLNTVACSIIGVFIYLIGTRLFDRRIGLISSVIFLLSPFTIFWGTIFQGGMVISMLFSTVAIFFLILGLEKQKFWFFALNGAFLGLAFLSRKSAAVLALGEVALLLFLFIEQKEAVKKASNLFLYIGLIALSSLVVYFAVMLNFLSPSECIENLISYTGMDSALSASTVTPIDDQDTSETYWKVRYLKNVYKMASGIKYYGFYFFAGAAMFSVIFVRRYVRGGLLLPFRIIVGSAGLLALVLFLPDYSTYATFVLALALLFLFFIPEGLLKKVFKRKLEKNILIITLLLSFVFAIQYWFPPDDLVIGMSLVILISVGIIIALRYKSAIAKKVSPQFALLYERYIILFAIVLGVVVSLKYVSFLWAMPIAGLGILAIFIFKEGITINTRQNFTGELIVITFFALVIFYLVYHQWFFYYLMEFTVIASLMLGAIIMMVVMCNQGRRRYFTYGFVILILISGFISVMNYYEQDWDDSYTPDTVKEVGAYLREHTSPDEEIFCPQRIFLVEADRRMVLDLSPFPYNQQFTDAELKEIGYPTIPELINIIDENETRYFVGPTFLNSSFLVYKDFDLYFKSNYQLEKTFGPIEIYRRIDSIP